MQPSVSIRTTLSPGDLGAIVSMHGILYAREHGFDATFEAYVAGPLADFVRAGSQRECLWIAERGGQIVGSVAIVAAATDVAQLRWFLVDPTVRGVGLGKQLLDAAIAFSQQHGYRSIILWTVSALTTAAHLYGRAGFTKTESHPRRLWSVDVVEEKYERGLG